MINQTGNDSIRFDYSENIGDENYGRLPPSCSYKLEIGWEDSRDSGISTTSNFSVGSNQPTNFDTFKKVTHSDIVITRVVMGISPMGISPGTLRKAPCL